MMLATINYIEALKKIDFSEASEVSLRTAFENYLNDFITENELSNFKVLHEGKRIGKFGVPDFRISINESMVGYIETKKTDENLDKILKSEQIKKYLELSENLIITNYFEFIWLKGDDTNKGLQPLLLRETLCYISDIENNNGACPIVEKAEKVEKLLVNFFSCPPEKITQPQDLAKSLAVRCKNLKEFINNELERQEEQNQQDILQELYNAFKEFIFSELTISEFSDAFAQMITFGLYLAGLNADNEKTGDMLSIKNTKDFIPSNFQLIKELYKFFEVLEKNEYKDTKWIIDEVISIINNIQWFELKQNLSFNKRVKDKDGREIDPFIYFYETFLATYDYNLRKAKGVYYTPPEVVNFIVRAIDEVLINTFKLPQGLAQKDKVTVLDFATGTGTFLLEIFKIVLNNSQNQTTEKRKIIIQEHILQNLFGFEYLIAPYTIAHLKLSQYLKENGYEFQENERLQVYLTNTLEPVDRQVRVPFMPQLTKETQSAQEIKDKPILVITGNPPYSGHSKNNSKWINAELKKYFVVDGKPLGEKNPKWLQDDYVKFIRFAQDKMDKAEQGVVGIITNHSFLDNPTFRGMRQSLMNSFDQIFIIDLHGNSKKKEKTPDNEKDENVFDIQQGVCISIFVKLGAATPCSDKGIFHANFWGKRLSKFNQCLNNSLNSIEFTKLEPNKPFYLFVPQNQDVRKKYDAFWSVKDIFNLNSVGIVTAKDELFISYNEKELKERIYEFKKLEYHDIKNKYKLTEKFYKKRKNYFENLSNKTIITKKINYRPFDVRTIWWDNEIIERNRNNVMQHFEKDNIGLISIRNCQGTREWSHVFLSKLKIDLHIIPIGSYIFPLYKYNGNGNGNNENYLFKVDDKKDNFTNDFRNFIRTKFKDKEVDENELLSIEKEIINLQKSHKQLKKFISSLESSNTENSLLDEQLKSAESFKNKIKEKTEDYKNLKNRVGANYDPTPEEVFNYIYAILHSKTYREKYLEFLKMDFPRIPFTDYLDKFLTISALGKELIDKHLLNDDFEKSKYSIYGNYLGSGSNIVEKINYYPAKNNEETGKLYINTEQYFDNVPEYVYSYQIGGYQVLDKFLKERKDRNIFYEFEQITTIIRTIVFTEEQMQLIDKETEEWI